MKERATELEFLRWFYSWADFGPSDSDVRDEMKDSFMADTGKNLPEDYNLYCDGETSTDEEEDFTDYGPVGDELECK